MARWIPWTLVLVLAMPTMATAKKKLEKMSDAELIEVMVTAKDDDDREDAAELLGERGSEEAIDALGAVCTSDPEKGVCDTAVEALADIGGDVALGHLVNILQNDIVSDGSRKKALKQLLEEDASRADAPIPVVLGTYRKLEAAFTIALLKALVDRDLRDAADLTILVAKDRTLKRKPRLKALEAAESLNHPLLYDAYLSLLDDDDKKVRIQACKGLARSGMPGSVVAPALENVVRTDDKGGARAAALAALKYYAHPGLLPLIHTEVLNEKDPIAWSHAVDLLIALADASSVDTIHQVLRRDDNMVTEGVVALIHLLVRIGDPSSAHALESLEDRTKDDVVEDECEIALKHFQENPNPGDYVPTVPAGIIIWDMSAPEPDVPTLAVEIDANGIAVWINE